MVLLLFMTYSMYTIAHASHGFLQVQAVQHNSWLHKRHDRAKISTFIHASQSTLLILKDAFRPSNPHAPGQTMGGGPKKIQNLCLQFV